MHKIKVSIKKNFGKFLDCPGKGNKQRKSSNNEHVHNLISSQRLPLLQRYLKARGDGAVEPHEAAAAAAQAQNQHHAHHRLRRLLPVLGPTQLFQPGHDLLALAFQGFNLLHIFSSLLACFRLNSVTTVKRLYFNTLFRKQCFSLKYSFVTPLKIVGSMSKFGIYMIMKSS